MATLRKIAGKFASGPGEAFSAGSSAFVSISDPFLMIASAWKESKLWLSNLWP